MTTETTSPVPPHVEEAVATIAALHAAHHREARGLQKAVSRGRDRKLGDAQSRVTDIRTRGARPISLPPIGAIVSTIALYLAAMILMTQRHDDEMATRREQITLELAILSEQKSSKIIALLEEFRRNDPNQGNDPTKWLRPWQSPPMRRWCSMLYERRKRRRTEVRDPSPARGDDVA
jgi:hypothetical protein